MVFYDIDRILGIDKWGTPEDPTYAKYQMIVGQSESGRSTDETLTPQYTTSYRRRMPENITTNTHLFCYRFHEPREDEALRIDLPRNLNDWNGGFMWSTNSFDDFIIAFLRSLWSHPGGFKLTIDFGYVVLHNGNRLNWDRRDVIRTRTIHMACLPYYTILPTVPPEKVEEEVYPPVYEDPEGTLYFTLKPEFARPRRWLLPVVISVMAVLLLSMPSLLLHLFSILFPPKVG